MKLCQVITELAPAGAERCVSELARRLPKGEFDCHVMALRGGAVADELRDAGIPVHVLDIRCRFDLPRFARMVDIFRRERFDLVHTHLFHAGLVGRAAARRAGVAHILHSEHIAERRFLPWRFWWAKLTADACEKIICVSNGVRDHHMARTHLDVSRYTVIYNGIDTDIFKPDPETRPCIRRQLGLADEQRLCLFAGRLDRQKGLETLLDGFDRAAACDRRLVLAIAGEGPQDELVRQGVRRHPDRIHALGYRKDIPQVMAAADIFCMPSRWEGFGLSAAEAMACELPVIATNVAGLAEVVVDGVTGILLAPDDGKALAEAIVQLSANPESAHAMGRAGRRRVEEHFSISSFTEGHIKLYRQTNAT